MSLTRVNFAVRSARIFSKGLITQRWSNDAVKAIMQKQFSFLAISANNHITKINQDFSRNYSKKAKVDQRYSSDSDSDFEPLGHRGESSFWRRKIRTFHRILDVNTDGVISYDDFKLWSDRFISLGHLSEEQTVEFRQIIKNMWEKLWGEITPYNVVTAEQYLENMHHVLNDRKQVQNAYSFLPFLFKAVDKDASGEISIEEYKLFFKCLGLSGEDARCAFLSIDGNNDGKVTLKEFIGHGKDFFLTEDEERVSKHFWGPLVEDHHHVFTKKPIK